MSLFDSINETNRAYCLHHVKRSMFLYKSMNYTVKTELYGFVYGSYGFLWILFTILTGVVHSGLACMVYMSVYKHDVCVHVCVHTRHSLYHLIDVFLFATEHEFPWILECLQFSAPVSVHMHL